MKVKEQLKTRWPAAFKRLKRGYYRLAGLNPLIGRRYLHVAGAGFMDLKTLKAADLQPNLFVVGAEKAGTTSLHSLLDQHPDIFMSKPNKEPHYAMPLEFTRKYFDRGDMPIRSKSQVLRQHMLKGYGGQRYIGESTTAYTRGRLAQSLKTPELIKNICPEAKIIYIVRNPFERLISSYAHRRREGWTAQTDLSADVRADESMVETSRYAKQIELFERSFPGNVLVLRLKDLSQTAELSSRVCEFLGLPDYKFTPAPKLNRGGNKTSSKFTPEVFEELKQTLEPEVQTLKRRYRLNLSHWDLSKKTWMKGKGQ